MAEREVDGAEPFCYLTTTGRRSGRPHEIEIWFGAAGPTLYLLAGGRDRSDWVRNLQANPSVQVRIGGRSFAAHARILGGGTEEDVAARALLVGKYQTPGTEDLRGWGEASLAIALDLLPAEHEPAV